MGTGAGVGGATATLSGDMLVDCSIFRKNNFGYESVDRSIPRRTQADFDSSSNKAVVMKPRYIDGRRLPRGDWPETESEI